MKFDRKGHQTYQKKLIFYICFSSKKRVVLPSNVDRLSITDFWWCK